MTTLKRTENSSRTNVFIDLIEDASGASAESITVTKKQREGFDTSYEVAVDGQVIGWVMGSLSKNFRPYGKTLQVRLNDSIKWSTQTIEESKATGSKPSRLEAIYSLVNGFYA